MKDKRVSQLHIAEALKDRNVNAYEYGVLVAKVKDDELHRLRCLEGVIYTLGELNPELNAWRWRSTFTHNH